MNTSFFGSICITDLLEKLKEKHSSFSKADNGKIYQNITVWLNEEEDKFGNVLSIQANVSKELVDKEKKFYLGNCKKSKPKVINDNDLDGIDDIDLPQTEQAPKSEKDPKDDLPF